MRRRSTGSGAASASAQLEWPLKRITVNLAPAGLRKEGSGFDLSIALAVLAASRQIPADRLAEHAAVGELALDGRVRPVRGAFAVAEGARRAGLERILCAPESACEAELGGVEAVPVRHLAEAVAYLRGELRPPPAEPPDEAAEPDPPDLADVRGQERARRALELAAAGGHNLLLAGPPGTGKTMLGRRLPSILPPLEPREALEVMRIHSVAGVLLARAAADHAAAVPGTASQRVDGRDRRRRLRAASGGGEPRASRRAPAGRAARVPAAGARGAAPAARGRRRVGRPRPGPGALPGPVPAGRDDEPVPVRRARAIPPPSARARRSGWRRFATSSRGRCSIASTSSSPCRGRGRRSWRRGRRSPPRRCASASRPDAPDWTAPPLRRTAEADELLGRAVERLPLSGRGRARVARVARTVAALAGAEAVLPEHVAEALAYRSPKELAA